MMENVFEGNTGVANEAMSLNKSNITTIIKLNVKSTLQSFYHAAGQEDLFNKLRSSAPLFTLQPVVSGY